MNRLALQAFELPATLLDILMTPLQRRTRRNLIDLRELPDHLKRDIGVLDGHEVPGSSRRCGGR